MPDRSTRARKTIGWAGHCRSPKRRGLRAGASTKIWRGVATTELTSAAADWWARGCGLGAYERLVRSRHGHFCQPGSAWKWPRHVARCHDLVAGDGRARAAPTDGVQPIADVAMPRSKARWCGRGSGLMEGPHLPRVRCMRAVDQRRTTTVGVSSRTRGGQSGRGSGGRSRAEAGGDRHHRRPHGASDWGVTSPGSPRVAEQIDLNIVVATGRVHLRRAPRTTSGLQAPTPRPSDLTVTVVKDGIHRARRHGQGRRSSSAPPTCPASPRGWRRVPAGRAPRAHRWTGRRSPPIPGCRHRPGPRAAGHLPRGGRRPRPRCVIGHSGDTTTLDYLERAHRRTAPPWAWTGSGSTADLTSGAVEVMAELCRGGHARPSSCSATTPAATRPGAAPALVGNSSASARWRYVCLRRTSSGMAANIVSPMPDPHRARREPGEDLLPRRTYCRGAGPARRGARRRARRASAGGGRRWPACP